MNGVDPEKKFKRGLPDNANPKFTERLTPKGNKYLTHLPLSVFIALLAVCVIYLIPDILKI